MASLEDEKAKEKKKAAAAKKVLERLRKAFPTDAATSVTVDGKEYGDYTTGQPVMTPLGQMLNDEEVAAVLTYVRQSFGNNLPPVKAAQVKKVRAATAGRTAPYTPEELLKEHPLGAPAKAEPAKKK